MGMYLIRWSYTSAAIKSMMDSPEDRSEAVASSVESVGGKLHGFWFAFGEFDGYAVGEFPDNEAVAAFAVRVGAAGALSKYETIPLMTPEQGMESFRRAAQASYQPPGG